MVGLCGGWSSKRFRCLFLWLHLFAVVQSSTGAEPAAPAGQTATPPPGLQSLLDERISAYNRAFPDILFVQYAGGETWLDDATSIEAMLGYQAVNLDYEHPPELREDLLYLSIERLLFMLRSREASASLYKVGTTALAEREHLCILTLDPYSVATDEAQATRHLLVPRFELLAEFKPDVRLDPEDHLRFVFDHEAFHCLDARYNRPQPISFKEHWAHYWHHHGELGADAFAVAMHVGRHGRITDYARRLRAIRGLAVLLGDPDHLTHAALSALHARDPQEIHAMTPMERFRLASQLRAQVAPDYAGYLEFRRAAHQAMKRLGLDEELLEQCPPALRGRAPEDAIQRLLAVTADSYTFLTGDARLGQ